MPTIETMSATTEEAVSIPPAPGPSSVISRIASPWSITALKAPVTAASGWRSSTSEGRTRTSSRPSTSVAEPIRRGVSAKPARRPDLGARDPLDAVVVDVVEDDAGAEGDGREDRHLGRRVGAGHVLRRVGFGIPEPLRLGQRGLVLLPLAHAREDEVRRPVDDPEHAVDVRDDERLAEHLDHRDRRAHRCLEAQLHAGLRGSREELRAAARDELLVRRHDRLASAEELEHARSGRLETACDLGHDRDRRIVADRLEVGREDALRRREVALAIRIPDERTHHAQAMPCRTLDLVGALGQEAVDRRADVAVAEQRDGDVHGGHRPTLGTGPAVSTRGLSTNVTRPCVDHPPSELGSAPSRPARRVLERGRGMPELPAQALDQRRCLRAGLGEALVGARAERTGEGVDLRDGRTSLLVHASIAADEASRECNDFVPNS